MTAARVTLITNTLLNPGTGAPVVGHDVSIRLNTVGFISGGTAEKVKTRTVTTDSSGVWTVALEVNADIDPADTYYTVQEFAGLIWTFVVPYSLTPLTLRSCLVDAPTNSDPLTAGVPLPSSAVPSGYVWTTDGAGSGDYAAESGGSAVTSVNGHVGTVVLAATDVGADASGAAAAAQAAAIAASQPLDSDLTAIAALTTTTYGRALLALADAAAGRTALALGSAATQASTAFDAAGAAAAAQAAAIAASQPLDSDLTAIAALTTTSYGRSYLALADAAAGRTLLALGTAAVAATGDFDAAGAAAAAQAASQPLDSDLTAIAALSTTSFGRSFNALADAAAGRTLLALGTAATSNTAAFDAAGAAAAAQAASQPLNSDLTAIAALVTTSFGRSFLALADAAAGRTLLALGTLATQSGTFSGTSSGTNTGDQDLSALAPKASPALTGTPTAPTASVGTNTTQLATTAFVLANGGGALNLTRQAKAANYTAVLGDLVVCDTTGGTFTVTLPAASGGKGTVVVKWTAGTVAPIIAVTGSDHIDTSTGSTGGSFTLLNQAARYESDGTALWIIGAGSFAISTLDARYPLAATATTKGDLLAATASATLARLAIGADGTVLTADSTQPAALKYARPAPYPAPSSGDWIVGQFATGATGTTIASQDDMYAMPIWIPTATTFNSIAIVVATAAASAVMRLGIYSPTSGGKPGTLLLDAGTVSAATTGVKQITISQQLTPGLWWLTAVSQVAAAKWTGYSAPLPGWALAASSLIMQVPSSNMWHVNIATGALPASPTWAVSLNATTAGTPIIGLVAA